MDRSALKIRDTIIKKFNLNVLNTWEVASQIDNSYHAYCTFISNDNVRYCFSIGLYTYVLSSDSVFLYHGYDKDKFIEVIAQVI